MANLWAHSKRTISGSGARILLDLFQNLTGAIFLVVGDVPVDSEACVDFVNLDDLPAQSLKDANWSLVAYM